MTVSAGLRRRLTMRGRRPSRWAINIASPQTAVGDLWGDTYFAAALATALQRLGHHVDVLRHGAHDSPHRREHDVSLTLRGLDRVAPVPGAVNVLWVISHPELVTDAELAEHAVVAASSGPWARAAARRLGRAVHVVQQATDATRFRPVDATAADAPICDALFVGVRPRARERPVVTAALAAAETLGLDVAVYGRGWSELLPPHVYRGDNLPNDRLPEAYRRAAVVLNDHWADMAEQGFMNNRLFDAVASGARVISDRVAGIEETFRGAVQIFDEPRDLRRLLGPERDSAFPDRAERRRIADLVRAEHSFDARAQQLLELVRAARRQTLRRS